MKKKIGIVSLGCPKNLVDSELMLGILKNDGFEIVNDKDQANVIIVNTCGFIESAKQESINTILEMASLKKQNCELLIATGCLAQRYRQMIIDEIPEVDAVLGTGSYSEIALVIKDAYGGKKMSFYGELDGTAYLDGERIISTGKGYAYLKIAEGCDNRCTYCVIPSLRGPFRSRKKEVIIKEAEALVKSGVKELIVVAQDTTRYGTDIYGKRALTELLKSLGKIDGMERIRLLYCYPEEIDDELIDEIAQNDKICKYLDIPIQHISDSVLKRMARRGSSAEIKGLMEKLQQRIPEIILRTSLIVGFPGETEEDFEELADFILKYRFDRLGIFMYSREEGTPAAKMKQQVPSAVKKARYKKLMQLQNRISSELNSKRLGKTYKVLVEGVADDGIFYFGRSCAEAPDIDGLIYFTSSEPLEINDFVEVEILEAGEYDITGEVSHESAK